MFIFTISYYTCATPDIYCKGSVVKLVDGTIVTKKPHTHESNDFQFYNQNLKKQFRNILINRAKVETVSLKSIYDEESIR